MIRTGVVSLNLTRLAYILVAAAVTAAATAFAVAYQWKQPSARFEDFFRQALAGGSRDDNKVLGRVAAKYDVCVYGPAGTRTEKLILLFFEFVREATWMEPNVVTKSRTADCPLSTFLYVLHHQGDKEIVNSIIGDILFIANRSGLTEMPSHSRISQYGTGVVMVEEGKEPRQYAAINEIADARSDVDHLLARNIVQQELVQLLLYASDIQVDRQPLSIIEERWKPGLVDVDPQQRAQWASLNVPNMCKYDIMLLLTLYARDESIVDSHLGSYVRYIRENYSAIESRAREIQDEPRYRELFATKC
jgi:hypothetical protein